MLKDLQYAARALRHRPGFALTAILSIALGIGATSSVFSFADAILLRPLPVARAAEVVTLRSTTPSGTFGGISWQDYLSFRNQDRPFSGLVAYQLARFGFAQDSHAQPQLKGGYLVSANFFEVLGTEPRLGRGFRNEDNEDAVVVLDHDFWQTEFHGDSSVLGRHIRLNGLDFTIAGVAPETFTGMDQYSRPAFFVLSAAASKLLPGGQEMLNDRQSRGFTVKGRLRAGLSIPQASSQAAALAKSLETSNPQSNRAIGAAVRTELQTRLDMSPGTGAVLTLLFSVALTVLAIACANVANLMLGRGRSRAREIAVRLAIGASRFRLVRQLMAESLLISLAGGGVGLLMASSFVSIASSIEIPGDLPIRMNFQLDARVLLFTSIVAVLSAVLFGLIPAVRSTRTDLVPALKSGEADQARKRVFGRSALVVTQVAGSLVLLLVTAQLIRGCYRALGENPGFRRDHVVMMSFDPSLAKYKPEQTERLYREIVDRARALPGAAHVSLAATTPLSTSLRLETVSPEGYQFPMGQDSIGVWTNTVDENYLDTLGIAVLRGRGILATDRAGSPPIGLVSETFAQRYFGGSAVGKRLKVNGRWIEIAGVTAAGKYLTGAGLEPSTEALHLPLSQNPESKVTLLVHTKGDPAQMAAPLRNLARSIDPGLPVFGIRTMSDFFEQRSVKQVELLLGTVGAIGLIGLALAVVGLYAVVAWQVASRTREIGIRMAIGADQLGVIRMILKQAGTMSLAGVLIGGLLGFAASRALSVALRVPFDPLLFMAIPVGLLATTLLAAAIPALRAAQIAPLEALRQD